MTRAYVVTPRRITRPDGDQVGGWRHRAACRPGAGVHPETFFPAKPNGGDDLAVHVCLACPVRAACREYAITTGQADGIWGGLTRRQLRAAIVAYRKRRIPRKEHR